eukprot:CAMPEP_0204649634 /NCGR_PEP_ID=MMETSP0718-20130828/10046_1 /ASSEMBLY_ACC=CAM_ASM_000674 /TAXON_ID=230516 /ORGANISM="Chaetoceros curvisetus" /LENGTH=119 /DNA_ID=CAMNT_0051672783 /DNA_START=185 /DNA_END=544 /DNA_ORIENTATION=+
MTKIAEAHIQLSVSQVSGLSVKTAMRGSKKFLLFLLTKSDESSIYLPSSLSVEEHPGESSFSSKHSHFGRVVPLTMASKLQTPRPAQLAGQNISGHALLSLGHVSVAAKTPPVPLNSRT